MTSHETANDYEAVSYRPRPTAEPCPNATPLTRQPSDPSQFPDLVFRAVGYPYGRVIPEYRLGLVSSFERSLRERRRAIVVQIIKSPRKREIEPVSSDHHGRVDNPRGGGFQDVGRFLCVPTYFQKYLS